MDLLQIVASTLHNLRDTWPIPGVARRVAGKAPPAEDGQVGRILRLLTGVFPLKLEKNLAKTVDPALHNLDSCKSQSTIKRRISAHAGGAAI
jgi:hypothetical protein